MQLSMLLLMASEGMGDRIALGSARGGCSMAELADRARRAATWAAEQPGDKIGLVDLNSEIVPVALFGTGMAGKPFVPINYRLGDDQLRAIVARTAPSTIIVGAGVAERIGEVDGVMLVPREDVAVIVTDPSSPGSGDDAGAEGDGDDVAVLLYTSGTTGEPKAAVLRHRNLVSYVLSTVEFAGAGEDEAAVVSVPPYHIAGISSVLSATFSGRRVVHLEQFDPQTWVDTVRTESATHAMVVPTMLTRILDVIAADGGGLPSLRALSYGGGPMPTAVIERAMGLLPHVGFVNAYGLTETSSTVALLGPDDHREAFASKDPSVRRRLGSVGRPLDTIEVTIRGPEGEELDTGERGEIWVRGDQVAGEYVGRAGAQDGWFDTRDAGHLDRDGFLFVHGRLDDVIVRGGENLSPGEIEDAILEVAGVVEAAVVGVPDEQWGEKVVAAIVTDGEADVSTAAIQDHVRGRLRSTKTPEHIEIVDALPFSETGKLLRRVLREQLAR